MGRDPRLYFSGGIGMQSTAFFAVGPAGAGREPSGCGHPNLDAIAPAPGRRCRQGCPGGSASCARARGRRLTPQPATVHTDGRVAETAPPPGGTAPTRWCPSARARWVVVSERARDPVRASDSENELCLRCGVDPPAGRDGREHHGYRRPTGGCIDMRRGVAVRRDRARRGKALSRWRVTRCNCERPKV